MQRIDLKEELWMVGFVILLYAVCIACLPWMIFRDWILELKGKPRATTRGL
jgi:hypothetical protein